MEPLQPGLYELLLTEQIKAAVEALGAKAKLEKLDKSEAPSLIAQHLHRLIKEALEAEDGDDHAEKRAKLFNELLQTLARLSPDTKTSAISNLELNLCGVLSLGQNALPPTPQSSLTTSSLFTGSGLKPQLSNELLAEMQSADQVEMLISFIKNSGLRLLRKGFDDMRDRNVPVRIITTTYMGASDAEAIETLANYPNVEIKVSYDTKHTRLHAKAYYFHRNSGFGTAYVGSSNMSNPAMSEGLEWNLKATQHDLPQILRAFKSEFDGYWNSKGFQPYKAGVDGPKLKAALAESRGDTTGTENTLTLIEIFPRPYQERILEALESERANRSNFRNLLVAATGTGKTIIAAFDYKRYCDQKGGRPRLLFLAHRDEILKQSVDKFRQVLKDANFGERMSGRASAPTKMDHLFCTVQTANSRKIWETLGRDYYDFIIVDEAHHATAETYSEILKSFSPKVLLGMTATPERMDGDSILPYFNDRISADLRLPEALEEKLLCPFHYFCVSDPVSLAEDSFWDNGKYSIAALERAYVENQTTSNQRLAAILEAVQRYTLGDLKTIKGLGFCASVKHADYMAHEFTARGLPSLSLSAETDRETRSAAVQRLQSGELKFIFTVDLFNEGVDIPEANLLLFLRPTDSLTVYLQQLGRGLRHSRGKECLLVLDFVAQMHRRYRIDRKFAALLPGKRFNIQREAQANFPHVPPGCSIQLEKQAMEVVVANIKAAYANIKNFVSETLKTYEQDTQKRLTFGNYIKTYAIDPMRILELKPWHRWKAEAKGEPIVEEPMEIELQQASERILQATGPEYLRNITKLPQSGVDLANTQREAATMLHSLLWQKPGSDLGVSSLGESFDLLRQNPMSLSDLVEVAEYSLETTTAKGGRHYPNLPLELHAHYGNSEIQAAFGRNLLTTHPQSGPGVLHFEELKSYALLVTLKKSERDFSPTTMFKDYPISRTLFHWESQAKTTQESPTGQNLIRHAERGYSVFLFIREIKKQGNKTLPFQFMGKVRHFWHEGERPISFKWELEHPMPAELLEGRA
jgi:superfamily II DNA or RNA helicase/HKD family nuclease